MNTITTVRLNPKWWLYTFTLSTLSLIGCDDEGKKNQDNGGEVPSIRAGEQAGMEAGMEAGMVIGGMMGGAAGVEGGMENMGGEGGMSGDLRINNCEDLCGLYDSCGSVPSPWGDACLTGCMEQDWESMNFRSYVICLVDEGCDNISSCRIPPPPLPTCEEACALTDACEADFRLPTALTQMGTCGGACQDPSWARQITACVQDHRLNLCDAEPAFARCILEDRGSDCLELCDALSGCNTDLEVIDCAVECMMEAPEDDPLAELHRLDQRACVIAASSCEELDGCQMMTGPSIGESVERACMAGQACGVFVEDACPEVMAAVAGSLSASGVSCLADQLETNCDSSLISCLSQGFNPSEQICSTYCRAAAICDALPEGQVEFDCIEGCNSAVSTQDPSALAAYQGRFTCSEANSCADFTACVALGGGALTCEEHCAARANCGDDDDVACQARCESNPNTERVRVERACSALLSCDAQAELCDLPPAPNCVALCEPLRSCGVSDDSCELRCDNDHFVDPAPFLPLLSCVNATERCDERADCENDPARGAACVAYCEYQVACQDSTEEIEACVVRCARGELEAGEELNGFALARSCLSTQVGASCAAQEACFTGELSSLCSEVCATTAGCGFEVGAEGCVEACEADATGFDGLACIALSDSRAGGCAGAASCLGIEPPVPTPACEQLCAIQRTCDPSTDLFLCHASCIESDEGDLARATCASLSTCDSLDLCLTADVSITEACSSLCVDQAMSCSGEFGADARFSNLSSCEESCVGVTLALGSEQEESFIECVSEAMCDEEALNLCWAGDLTDPSAEICGRSWVAVNRCNMGIGGFLDIPDEMTFMMQCASDYMLDMTGTIELVECLEQSLAMDPSCLSAAFSCGFF